MRGGQLVAWEQGLSWAAWTRAAAALPGHWPACNCLPRLYSPVQGSVLQCGLILLSSILLWAFRSGESSSGYGYITH